jgi:hypothetical protein
MLRLRQISSCAAPLACLVGALPLRAQTDRHRLSGDRVAIYNLAGKLRVEAGDGSDVVVEVTPGGRDGDRLRVEEGSIRGRETLRVIYPSDRIVYPALEGGNRTSITVSDDGTWGDDHSGGGRRTEISGSGSGLEAYADIIVRVPRGQQVTVNEAVGDARITSVDADVTVNVASADVSAERTRGHLKLDTGSGSVSVTDAQGDLELDTGSGGVTIRGIRGETLHMDTGSGSIEGGDVDVTQLKADVGSGGVRLNRIHATQVDVDAGSGSTELELLSTVDHLEVGAGSGGVTVHLPASQSADVDIETGSGGIDTDFDIRVTRFERRHMVGRIGDGRGSIRIESGSGQVRLLKG